MPMGSHAWGLGLEKRVAADFVEAMGRLSVPQACGRASLPYENTAEDFAAEVRSRGAG